MQIDRMTLPVAVRDFLLYLDVDLNRSALTVEEYASDLRTLFRFLKSGKSNSFENSDIDISDISISEISEISYYDLQEFLSYCKNTRNNSARTRARKMTTYRMFFGFLEKRNLIKSNPTELFNSIKIDSTLPKYLTVEQSVDLLRSVDGTTKERDYCMITLFLNCGLRLSELVSLNYKDIIFTNSNNAHIVVTGKGKKQRVVYLNKSCIDAVNAYMLVRPKDGVIDKDALFLSRLKKRISPKTVQYVVKTYLKKCGLGEGYSVHKLRHTAATLMYQYGHVDTMALKEILGHENLGTTQIYTHVSNEQLQHAVDSNPLASLSAANKNSSSDLTEDDTIKKI